MQIRSAKAISLFIVVFAAAGTRADAGQERRVVASFYPVYIMAKNVAKDVPGVSVTMLAPPAAGCLHDYSVTAGDMKKLSGAQVFVANGAGAESFLDKVISRYPRLKIIELDDGVALIKGSADEGDNPHVWVSIANAILQVKNLGRAMGEFDPAHAALYEKNTAAYVARLEELRRKMHDQLAPYKGKSIITFHEAFAYFAREFEFTIAAVIEREPGCAPSAQELAQTIDSIKTNAISAVFSEPQYSSSSAQAIERETGVTVYVLDPAVTGPDDYDAYIHIMENNARVLRKAFER
jgi:zinc transport system substrate-binding protein